MKATRRSFSAGLAPTQDPMYQPDEIISCPYDERCENQNYSQPGDRIGYWTIEQLD